MTNAEKSREIILTTAPCSEEVRVERILDACDETIGASIADLRDHLLRRIDDGARRSENAYVELRAALTPRDQPTPPPPDEFAGLTAEDRAECIREANEATGSKPDEHDDGRLSDALSVPFLFSNQWRDICRATARRILADRVKPPQPTGAEFPRAPRDEEEREACEYMRSSAGDLCSAIGGKNWRPQARDVCNRIPGHGGDHVDSDEERVFARWPSTPACPRCAGTSDAAHAAGCREAPMVERATGIAHAATGEAPARPATFGDASDSYVRLAGHLLGTLTAMDSIHPPSRDWLRGKIVEGDRRWFALEAAALKSAPAAPLVDRMAGALEPLAAEVTKLVARREELYELMEQRRGGSEAHGEIQGIDRRLAVIAAGLPALLSEHAKGGTREQAPAVEHAGGDARTQAAQAWLDETLKGWPPGISILDAQRTRDTFERMAARLEAAKGDLAGVQRLEQIARENLEASERRGDEWKAQATAARAEADGLNRGNGKLIEIGAALEAERDDLLVRLKAADQEIARLNRDATDYHVPGREAALKECDALRARAEKAQAERDDARLSLTTATWNHNEAIKHMAQLTAERDSARADLARVEGERDGAREKALEEAAAYLDELGHLASGATIRALTRTGGGGT